MIRRVFKTAALPLVLGHAAEVELDNLVGVGPVGFLVREVGRPHETIDAHVMPQLDAGAVLRLRTLADMIEHSLTPLS